MPPAGNVKIPALVTLLGALVLIPFSPILIFGPRIFRLAWCATADSDADCRGIRTEHVEK
jgi:hypothetical protein